MTAQELDEAANRLEEIQAEEEKLRSKLQEQVEEFDYTPPRAEKSKRLVGALYQFTVSRGVTTEIKDAEVERIQICLPTGSFRYPFSSSDQIQASRRRFLGPGWPSSLRCTAQSAPDV